MRWDWLEFVTDCVGKADEFVYFGHAEIWFGVCIGGQLLPEGPDGRPGGFGVISSGAVGEGAGWAVVVFVVERSVGRAADAD